MCRFTLYLGEPVLLSKILTEPANSLINQSLRAAEGHFPFNGDGFGITWYAPEVRPEPARFRSLRPAWSNTNLPAVAKMSANQHTDRADVELPTNLLVETLQKDVVIKRISVVKGQRFRVLAVVARNAGTDTDMVRVSATVFGSERGWETDGAQQYHQRQ